MSFFSLSGVWREVHCPGIWGWIMFPTSMLRSAHNIFEPGQVTNDGRTGRMDVNIIQLKTTVAELCDAL